MLNFVAFTKGTTEQEGLVDLSILVSASCGHMYGPVSFWHNRIEWPYWIVKREKSSFGGYICKTLADRKPLQNIALSAKNGLFLVKSTNKSVISLRPISIPSPRNPA